ncbi:hypothetical protein C4585_03120 [Candidatus Parcubacteria bacterium]|nr:MAG: hypothetical protein C4585_03120 [Candidatus Parcubacteria bacterium]
MSETVDVSWQDIEHLTKQLAKLVREDGFTPDVLIGITVSGLFPVGLLAKEFDTKDVVVVSARSYNDREQGKLQVTALPNVDLEGKNVLLVDEIADRGTTLEHIRKIFIEEYKVKELKSAVLVVNEKNCTFWPDFYVMKVDKWVVFPWDK